MILSIVCLCGLNFDINDIQESDSLLNAGKMSSFQNMETPKLLGA